MDVVIEYSVYKSGGEVLMRRGKWRVLFIVSFWLF